MDNVIFCLFFLFCDRKMSLAKNKGLVKRKGYQMFPHWYVIFVSKHIEIVTIIIMFALMFCMCFVNLKLIGCIYGCIWRKRIQILPKYLFSWYLSKSGVFFRRNITENCVTVSERVKYVISDPFRAQCEQN